MCSLDPVEAMPLLLTPLGSSWDLWQPDEQCNICFDSISLHFYVSGSDIENARVAVVVFGSGGGRFGWPPLINRV